MVWLAAAIALFGSAGMAVALSGGVAGAKSSGPVTATCTALLGNASYQLETGCTGTAKTKVSSAGEVVPDPSAGTAVVNWTNKEVTDLNITDTLTPGPGSCSPYLGVAASDVISETATVTGGTSKLTVGQSGSSTLCLYVAGGDDLVVGTVPFTF
jgi:hypothetical protein